MATLHVPRSFDPLHNLFTVAGVRMALHCHHYNCQLQKVVELTDYIDGAAILRWAAAEALRELLPAVQDHQDGRPEPWHTGFELYRLLGFGTLRPEGHAPRPAPERLTAPTSHFATGWVEKFGQRSDPACHFTRGYLVGLSRIAGTALAVREEACLGMGAPACRFRLHEPAEGAAAGDELPEGAPHAGVTVPLQEPEPAAADTAVDEARVVRAFSEADLTGDEEGFIPRFGVYLTVMPVRFYNFLSYRFERELERMGFGLGRSARELLIDAGEVCGIFTLGGISRSMEWEAAVAPMIRRPEDRVHGMVAVANSLGWGRWQVRELVPGRRLVLRAYNPYEALGYLQMYGRAAGGKCYMLTGVTAAIMDLVYGGEPGEDPENLIGRFAATERRCLAKGDPYCETEAVRCD